MKAEVITLLIVLAILGGVARADRPLDNAEISQILQTLTSRPARAWISSGTISATHEKYRAPKTTSTAEINSSISQAIQEHQEETRNTDLNPAIQKMCMWVKSAISPSTATISNCSFCDLCAMRSGSVCNRRKSTPTTITDANSVRQATTKRGSEPSGPGRKNGST